MGNGQYYDPSTGRFLTRGAQQGQSNPYTPWNSDPAGMLIAPLALLALVFGRKKTRTKFDQFIILFVIVVSVGLSVSACQMPTIDEIAEYVNNVTIPKDGIRILFGNTVISITPTSTETSTSTLTATLCDTATPTATSTSTPSPTITATYTSTPELIQFGVIFEGDWNDEQTTVILSTVTFIGQRLSPYVGGLSSNEVFKKVYGETFRFSKNGSGTGCEAGYYENVRQIVCGSRVDLTDRLLAHEFGHALKISIDFVNARQSTPTPTEGPYYDLQKAAIIDNENNWVTGTHPEGVFERTLRGYTGEYLPDVYHGREWSDWNSNNDNRARSEDFADMFLNWVFDSFDYSLDAKGAGVKRKKWMDENMQKWINLATR